MSCVGKKFSVGYSEHQVLLENNDELILVDLNFDCSINGAVKIKIDDREKIRFFIRFSILFPDNPDEKIVHKFIFGHKIVNEQNITDENNFEKTEQIIVRENIYRNLSISNLLYFKYSFDVIIGQLVELLFNQPGNTFENIVSNKIDPEQIERNRYTYKGLEYNKKLSERIHACTMISLVEHLDMNSELFRKYYESEQNRKNIEFLFPKERLQLNFYFTKSNPLDAISEEQLKDSEIKSKLIKGNTNKLEMCLGFESELLSGERILTGVTFDQILHFFQMTLNYFRN